MLSIKRYRAERLRRKLEGDAKKSSWRKYRYPAIFVVILILSALVYLVCFAYKPMIVPQPIANKVATLQVISPFEFSYVSDIQTQLKREQIAERVPPVYKVNNDYIEAVNNRIRGLLTTLNESQEAYVALTPEQKLGNQFFDEISNALRKKLGLNVSPEDIRTIYEYTTEKNRTNMIRQAMFYLVNLLKDGIYQDGDKTFSTMSGMTNVDGISVTAVKSESHARSNFLEKTKSLGLNDNLTYALYRAINQELRPDIDFDAETTRMRRDEARQKVQPVIVRIQNGETLSDSNPTNPSLQNERMRAYQKELTERKGVDVFDQSRNLIEFMACFWLVLAAALFITISKTSKNRKPRTVTIFSLLLLLNLGVERLIVHFAHEGYFDADTTMLQILIYATPVMIGPMIQVLLFGAYTGFVMALLISALTTLMVGQSITYFVLFFSSALLAIFFCNGATTRYHVILGGFFYGAFIALFSILIGISWGIPPSIFLRQGLAALFGGALTGVLTIGFLPIIERIFNQYSNITLLDFTDFNKPLLRRLQIEAPGTYHHSVMVSYLAEAAAAAVGANSLVCRIGGLYHDIGKIYKPEFFSENQGSRNLHDDQNPSMSALIIKSHIKEGVDLAKLEKLPKQVTDAISQHHGTSIITYFYNKAMNMAENANVADPVQALRRAGIEESTYRHEGVKPQNVENAIIMLADSCEAASRSMKKITQHGVEELVDNIFRAKMNDGQLDECPVTVKQLSKIKSSFVFTMLNSLHSRVPYNNDKK